MVTKISFEKGVKMIGPDLLEKDLFEGTDKGGRRKKIKTVFVILNHCWERTGKRGKSRERKYK